MKKYLLFAIGVLLLSSCVEPTVKKGMVVSKFIKTDYGVINDGRLSKKDRFYAIIADTSNYNMVDTVEIEINIYYSLNGGEITEYYKHYE
jgi:hypothetical protein